MGFEVLPNIDCCLGQVGKYVLQAGEVDLKCIKLFYGGSVGSDALGKKRLDKRVIYEKGYDVGTSLHGLIQVGGFSGVHVLKVCKA